MPTQDDIPPEDAFAALGNEHRVQVLRVLADAETDERLPLSFSEVYDRVDVNGTSQLAYHLDALEGVFVRRPDDGYALTSAGHRVVRAILSGAYNESPSFESTTVDGHCPSCGETTAVASMDETLLEVSCSACDVRLVTYDLVPGLTSNESPRAVLRSCDRRAYHDYGAALDGVCPECSGETRLDVQREDDPVPGTYYAVATCRCCDQRVFAPLEFRLLYHPGVLALYWEDGVDLTETPLYRVTEYTSTWRRTVESTSPFEVRFDVGDDRAFLVDGRLSVTPA